MPKIWTPGQGERLRELRKATGLSQEKLAELIDCSWMTVHRWETDQRAITPEHLDKLCEISGLDRAAIVEPVTLPEQRTGGNTDYLKLAKIQFDELRGIGRERSYSVVMGQAKLAIAIVAAEAQEEANRLQKELLEPIKCVHGMRGDELCYGCRDEAPFEDIGACVNGGPDDGCEACANRDAQDAADDKELPMTPADWEESQFSPDGATRAMMQGRRGGH